MLRMVIGMGNRRYRQKPVHEHEAEQQRPDQPGLFQVHHHNKKLSKRCRLDRFLLLNLRDHVVDHLLRQQTALDVLLHPSLLIDKHTHR